MSIAQKGRLTLAAYAAPSLPLAALTLPVYIFLPPFYAETLGLGLGPVALVLLLSRLFDVVTDPLIGIAGDATRGRHGRRRPWVLAGMPLVVLAVWQLLVPGDGAGLGHLLGWSLALYLGWTMMTLPLNAWGAELSDDYHERARITIWREGAVVAGSLAALGAIAASGVEREGALRAIALLVVVLLPVTTAAAGFLVPDRAHAATRAVAWRDGMAAIAGNRPFRRLVLAYLLNGIANGLPATLFVLFVTHVLGREDLVGPLLFLYFLCGLVAVPLWLGLARRHGKHRIWSLAMVWACAWFAWVPLLGPGDVWMFAVISVATGLSLGADLALPAAMQADVVDEDTLRTGSQRTGIYFALWSMTTKAALALALVAYPILDVAGLSEGRDGSGFVLALLYGLAPCVFKALAITLMWNHPVTAEAQAETLRRIRETWGDVLAGSENAHVETLVRRDGGDPAQSWRGRLRSDRTQWHEA